jgi:hypothetical protein
MSAKFNLDYVDDFQNNLLSMIGDETLNGLLQLVPYDAAPFMKPLRSEFENIKLTGK